MSHHPSGAHRADAHAKHRVKHIAGVSHTGSAALANRITPSDRSREKQAFAVRDSLAVEGGVPKERFDRPGRSLRARGGRTKHKGNTTVNVIVPGGAGASGAGVASPPVPRPVPPPAPPPMAGPPGGAGVAPPMGGMPPRPGMSPPGMMPPGGMPPGMPMRARGGRLPKGTPVWREGVADGTQVQNNPSGKNDQHDVNRKKPITYKNGGRAEGGATWMGMTPRQSAEIKKIGTPGSSKHDSGVSTPRGPISDTGMDTTQYDERSEKRGGRVSGGVKRAGGGKVGPLDKEMGYQTLKNSMVADRAAGTKALQNEQMQNADDISASLRGNAKGGRVKRRATGGAVHFFGDADMGIPHPFKGKDFSGNTHHITPKRGRDFAPGSAMMPGDKKMQHSASEARGHESASKGKGVFVPGTMKEPSDKAVKDGPKEHSKKVVGVGVGYPHQGGGGGARARLAKRALAYK
jgi:hypothetical protein